MEDTMLTRIAAGCAIVLLAVSTTARPQSPAGPGPGRVFQARQTSWWAADGLPASEIVARESTFVFRPDSARGWPSSGLVPAEFQLGENGPLRVTLVVRPYAGIEEVLVSAAEAACDTRYRDDLTSVMSALSLALVTPVDAGERDQALPSLTFGACDDTVITAMARSLSPFPRGIAEGRTFVHVGGTVRATWRIDRHLVGGETTVHARLTGWISGSARIAAERSLDSLDLDGRFRGFMVFDGPGERVDTVYGTWVLELQGHWVEDPRERQQRAFDYFVRHGRPMPEETAEGGNAEEPRNPYLALADSAARDTALIDSLVAARVRARSPVERAQIEEALSATPPPVWDKVTRASVGAPVRLAPIDVLRSLRYARTRDDTLPLGRDVAALLARELAPLIIQRRRLLNREDLGAAVVDVLGQGRGFVRDAGPVLADAAQRADDAMSRDLLLLAAYQADPPRYRALVESKADAVRGYGPIALAWLSGDGSATHWSWGVEAGQLDSLEPFPGADGSIDELERFFDEGRAQGVQPLAALAMRFEADGRDLGVALRRRFGADTAVGSRNVLARYLEAIGDTTARPWLRALLTGTADVRAIAYELLPADTVGDTTLIADVQRTLLGYVAGVTAILDTAGKPVAEPWVHDARPDQRILASDEVSASAIEPWRRHFLVMSMDSVRARVERDGLQMAWTIGPLTRIGGRYYVSVTLVPVGGPCLCGGGVNFTLERRGSQWVAVSAGRWIS